MSVITLTIVSAGLLGALVTYIWGVVSVYVVSFGIPQFINIRFADRVLYSLKWPLYPVMALTVFALMGYGFLRVVFGKGEKIQDVKPEEGTIPVSPQGEEVYKQ